MKMYMKKDNEQQKTGQTRSGSLFLSDNEKRDIVKFLEAGKPLPEKYRFLLFKDDREVELVWNGKSNEVTNVVLPFQVIEQIDEPREGKEFGDKGTLFDFSGKQITGWTNKLIWGDNKLILSSLKNGPMRKEIEAQGGLKLIYIDPPFDVGADFSLNITIGDDDAESFTKKPSVIEEIAYRDTWGKGADSFIAMIYERLKLMHSLLADDGSIYVHCGIQVNHYVRLALEEIFGKDNMVSEIIWSYGTPSGGRASGTKLVKIHEYILHFAKNYNKRIENKIYLPYAEKYVKDWFKWTDENGRVYRQRIRGKGAKHHEHDAHADHPAQQAMRDHGGDQAAHGVVSWVRMLRRRQPGRPSGANTCFPRGVSQMPTPTVLARATASERRVLPGRMV
jgi:DNA modification methylase